MIFRAEFQRGQQRVLADLLCGELVGRDAGEGVGALRRLGTDAAQPGGRAQRMHGAAYPLPGGRVR